MCISIAYPREIPPCFEAAIYIIHVLTICCHHLLSSFGCYTAIDAQNCEALYRAPFLVAVITLLTVKVESVMTILIQITAGFSRVILLCSKETFCPVLKPRPPVTLMFRSHYFSSSFASASATE